MFTYEQKRVLRGPSPTRERSRKKARHSAPAASSSTHTTAKQREQANAELAKFTTLRVDGREHVNLVGFLEANPDE